MKKLLIPLVAVVAIAAALFASPILADDAAQRGCGNCPAADQTTCPRIECPVVTDGTAVCPRWKVTPPVVAGVALAAETVPPVTACPRITDGSYGCGGSGGYCGHLGIHSEETLQSIAGVLGISYDTLVTRLNGGESIVEIAAALNKPLSAIVDVVVASQVEAINKLATDGTITRAQADEAIANLKARVEAMLKGEGFGGCFGSGPGTVSGGCGMRGGTDAPAGPHCPVITDTPDTTGTPPATNSRGYGTRGGCGMR